MEIQGTFKGLQRKTHRGQEEQQEKERERGYAIHILMLFTHAWRI